jgi:DNA-binding NtrC family response regulator
VLSGFVLPVFGGVLAGFVVREAGGGPRVVVSYSETAVAPAERTHRLTLAGGRDTDIVSEQPERPSLADGLISTAMQEEAEVEARISSVDDEGEVRPLASVEEELIRFALKFYRGQMSQVARKLGIGRSTLYRKLKDYDIDPDDPLKHVA